MRVTFKKLSIFHAIIEKWEKNYKGNAQRWLQDRIFWKSRIYFLGIRFFGIFFRGMGIPSWDNLTKGHLWVVRHKLMPIKPSTKFFVDVKKMFFLWNSVLDLTHHLSRRGCHNFVRVRVRLDPSVYLRATDIRPEIPNRVDFTIL